MFIRKETKMIKIETLENAPVVKRIKKDGTVSQAFYIKNGTVHYFVGDFPEWVSPAEYKTVSKADDFYNELNFWTNLGYSLRNYTAPKDSRKGNRKKYESNIHAL